MKGGETCQKTLEAFFGHTTFRPNQEAIIQDLIEGRDVLAVMATGGGKSLCYQLPALILGGLTIVVSPLIALMKDQVDDLMKQGIKAALLTSSQTYDQRKAVEEELKGGRITILYVSPERMSLGSFQVLLKTLHPKLFAIDEAHCISQWGHQFRKDYRGLSVIRDLFPKTPIIALTATATEEVREDIILQLRLRSPRRYAGGFDRDNITYSVVEERKEEHRFRRLVAFISGYRNKSGIVYCRSRKAAADIAEKLQKKHILALPYHAGISGNERSRVQDAFLKGDTRIVCATIAFGMGIDKPDVRFVVHFHPPKDIESFYQESGRAGRDGRPSESLLFYSKQDFEISKRLTEKEYTDTTACSIRLKKLGIMQDWCESSTCRRRRLLSSFGEVYPKARCESCDICLSAPSSPEDQIITGVTSLKGRYGIATAALILSGTSKKSGHDQLPAFGIAGEMPLDEVLSLINALIKENRLEVTENSRLKNAKPKCGKI
ncbi:MAG: ATP-dependent DNA helicase RecQ [Methanocalculus sp.]|uniref:RecQ family ATP-dependent DNA helicase n=1 Tax=Methanocalculus sp. TaxID=2004547 RepID=UPI0027264B83|nr:ATP-dependent DNA helicase RecQ [Methanocalculus sp.]MDO9539307.1 ATP-dependent DNA helicase RecQ [Methanocalculus sp.]